MRILQYPELKQLSFPDAQVIDMQRTEDVLVVLTDSAWLMNESFKSCHLVLKNWQTLQIRAYHPQKNQWVELPMHTTDLLKDICEADFDEHCVSLRGFGSESGQWLEYRIEGNTLILICYLLAEWALAA